MGQISTCQDKIIALLQTNAVFQGGSAVPIISKKMGNPAALLDDTIAKVGGGLVVLFHSAKMHETDTPQVAWDVQFTLTAVANPTQAITTGRPALATDICEAAAAALQYQFNGVAAGDQTETSRFLIDRDAVHPEIDPKRPFLDVQVLIVNTTIVLA